MRWDHCWVKVLQDIPDGMLRFRKIKIKLKMNRQELFSVDLTSMEIYDVKAKALMLREGGTPSGDLYEKSQK